MKVILLDTHAFLWALYEPKKLSPLATELISNPKNTRLISAASVWEISTKYRLGKLDMAKSLVSNFHSVLQHFMAEELPIQAKHSLLAGSFSQKHRDPFDRMLASQSVLEQVPLLSADTALRGFPAQILW